MRALGAPPGVVNATSKLYTQLRFRYKACNSLSGLHQRKNGYAQGDSWSLQIALAMMSVWDKFLHCNPAVDTCLATGSFVDGCHFLCEDTDSDKVVGAVSETWKKSLHFDSIAGMETNFHKTTLFAVDKPTQKKLQDVKALAEGPCALRCLNSFVLTGSVVTAAGKPVLDSRNLRVDKLEGMFRRVRFAPVRFAERIKLLQAVGSLGIFGTEIIGLAKQQYDRLQRAAVSALWGGKLGTDVLPSLFPIFLQVI